MKKYLIINGDDFGSSESANRGVIRAFTQGILRSASLMVPCPWFPQAATLAKEHKLACGLHMTLTCEYIQYQFGPLTRAPQLSRDGKGYAFVTDAGKIPADAHEIVYNELNAQLERCLDAGVKPAFMDAHMGAVPRWDNAFLKAAERLYERYRIPFLRLGAVREARDLPIDLIVGLGAGEQTHALKVRFREQLAKLPDGITYMGCHPAEMSPEMRGMELHDGFAAARQTDLDLLLDPEVREWLSKLNITPISTVDALSHSKK